MPYLTIRMSFRNSTREIGQRNLEYDLVRGTLLFSATKYVDRPSGRVGYVRNVEPTRLIDTNLLNLLEIILRKLNLLKVLANAADCYGFRYD